MPVINVEVSDTVARKFTSYKVVKSEMLLEELENNNIFVDFWEDWLSQKEFERYLTLKNSL